MGRRHDERVHIRLAEGHIQRCEPAFACRLPHAYTTFAAAGNHLLEEHDATAENADAENASGPVSALTNAPSEARLGTPADELADTLARLSMSPEPDVLMGSLAEEYSPPTQGGEPDDFEGVADHYGISEDVEMRAPEGLSAQGTLEDVLAGGARVPSPAPSATDVEEEVVATVVRTSSRRGQRRVPSTGAAPRARLRSDTRPRRSGRLSGRA